MASARAQPRYLVIGEILRPHGLRGELRTRVLSDNPERISQLKTVYLGDSPEAANLDRRALVGLRFNKEYALLQVAGCGDRNEAELLRGKLVMISVEQAAPLEADQYYLFQLLGLKVIAGDVEIGTVKEVLQTGANDVYIVESETFGEVLIPAHEETILNIDFDAESITMQLPDGLLPRSPASQAGDNAT
ncbi:MAG: ribosome maturation factor RimM [Chloroflexi bacterium]|nr:ribosome maturation factor RimM [Chloroflexota bacterium]